MPASEISSRFCNWWTICHAEIYEWNLCVHVILNLCWAWLSEPYESHAMICFRWVITPTNQSDIETKNILIEIFFKSDERVTFRFTCEMAGFSFDSGGRRCIKPILEKYQSGKVIHTESILSTENFWAKNFGLPLKRRKSRLFGEDSRRKLSDFKLPTWTDWIFLWAKTRNG